LPDRYRKGVFMKKTYITSALFSSFLLACAEEGAPQELPEILTTEGEVGSEVTPEDLMWIMDEEDAAA
jgi:hypothetical protein